MVGLTLGAFVTMPADADGRGERFVSHRDVAVDLLGGGDVGWLTGTRRVAEGLRARHLGLRIVRQDGGGGRPNPPWNLYGTHLRVGDTVTLIARFTGVRGEAALQLAGRPPVVYDEFLNDRGSVRVAVEGRSVWVGVVGRRSGQQLVAQREWRRERSGDVTLRLRLSRLGGGGRLSVTADGRRLGSVALKGAVSGGSVWFGLDAGDRGGSFIVSRLLARGPRPLRAVDVSPLVAGDGPGEGLGELAERRRAGFRVGAAMSLSSLASDPAFARLALGGDYGAMTTENALKAQFVHPRPGVFDFREADALVDIAERNGLDVHGHALVFGEANPRWLQRLARRHPERMRAVLRRHVRTVVSHFAGRVDSWDVVNEPLADYGEPSGPLGLRRSIWERSIGPDFLAIALRTAHQADPSALLFVNDYGLEAHDARWGAMRRLLERLRARGVPVDGVGLQAHVYEPGDEIDAADLRATFEDLADLGLVARISELDVHGEHPGAQARQYASILRTCVNSVTCVSLTTWGVSERYGSTSYLENGRLNIGDGLPWDVRLRPLPAVAAMRRVLGG